MNIQTLCGFPAKRRGIAAKPAKPDENSEKRRFVKRMASFLKKKEPSATVENFAVIIGVSVRHAYDIYAGKYDPSVKHILRLIRHFGEEFVYAVFHPLTKKDGKPRFKLRVPRRVVP